jgi:hypothetical protein
MQESGESPSVASETHPRGCPVRRSPASTAARHTHAPTVLLPAIGEILGAGALAGGRLGCKDAVDARGSNLIAMRELVPEAPVCAREGELGMARIWISYRRGDRDLEVRVLDRLRSVLGEEAVVGDLDSIASGEDFVGHIEEGVASCDALVVLIGPDWLEASAGARGPSGDLTRIEINAALEHGRRIIPVLVGGASMPSPEDLPDELAALARRNTFEITENHLASDVDRLVRALEGSAASEPAATAPRGGGGGSGMLTRPGAAVGDHVSLLLRSAGRGALPLAVVQSRPTPAVTPAAPVPMPEPSEARRAGAPMKQRVLTRGLVLAGASIAAVAAAIVWAIGCALDLPLDEDDEAADDIVDCTVFAPPSARTGDRLLVQVFAHLPVDAEIARALATEWDTAAKRRAVKSLELSIARGSRLGFQLEMPEAEVDEPVQSLRWDGRAQAVQFGVFLPATLDSSVLIGTVSASLNSVPIGHVKFKLALDADRAVSEEAVGDDARRYRSAFISYASQDRNEVLRSAQGLRAAGVRCFQDVLDLEPGERWERKLYLKIREGDLFVLFWSSAARDSEWVRKEAQYALDCKTSELDPPEIKPIIVADPPVPKPWPELAHLHFNDPAIYFMSR